MAGLFTLATPANADCSGVERAKIDERMVGVWGVKLADGSKSCITFRYQASGDVIQASNDHCANGGKAGSSTKHWRIDDACRLVMTGPNESGTPRAVHLVDGNKEIVVDAGNGPITLVRK